MCKFRKITAILAAVGLSTFSGAAAGGIPEPDVVLYGDVCVNGQRVLATSDVTILACVNCPSGFVAPGIGSYKMGSSIPAGNQYVLRLRLESLADGSTQSANAALVGQTARIFLRQGAGTPAFVRNYNITNRGVFERSDITIGTACVLPDLLSAVPPNNAIDGRQPSNPDGSQPAGWDSIDITFSGAANVLSAADFSVSAIGGSAPAVLSAVANGSVMTVRLAQPISPGAWTIIRYLPKGTNLRLGFLPGDTSGNGYTGVFDLIALIDALNGVTPRPIASIDINRSGQANAQDVRREIDLLSGIGAYEVWGGRSLPQ